MYHTLPVLSTGEYKIFQLYSVLQNSQRYFGIFLDDLHGSALNFWIIPEGVEIFMHL